MNWAYILISVFICLFTPLGVVNYVEAGLVDIARDTFKVGGVGAAIIQISLLGIVGWLLSTMAHSLGNKQLGRLIQVGTIFSCLGVVFNTVWGIFMNMVKALGI